MTVYGVCATSLDLCEKFSYEKGRGLDHWFIGWYTKINFPGSLGVGVARNVLPPEFAGIFQPMSAATDPCSHCGGPLVPAAQLPDLGRCPKCQRRYGKEDIDRNFRLCAHPIEISDDQKAEYAKQEEIGKLLALVPSLREHGFLPRQACAEKGEP